MPGWYEKNYWRTGFKSSLYDRLTPESYFESIRKVVGFIPDKRGQKIWDAGCGSGLLLVHLKDAFKRGMNYYGTDLLEAGLKQVKLRARELGIDNQVACIQNDLSVNPSLKENSIDIVVAHFSIYTIRDNEKRYRALKIMHQVLKPGGMLIVSCPSKNYDAQSIIKESLELDRAKSRYWNTMIKRLIFYPLTKWLGLNFIQRQLQSGQWVAYTFEALAGELRDAGFEIGFSETVYAGSAFLMCGHKTG